MENRRTMNKEGRIALKLLDSRIAPSCFIDTTGEDSVVIDGPMSLDDLKKLVLLIEEA